MDNNPPSTTSLRKQIGALRKGASLVLPIERRNTIRNYASDLSLAPDGRRYTTAADRSQGTIKITRTK